ncbi:DNA excision repair ckn1 [Hyphodiscus hymeniophilus]|uniref:DNA excision repair ckn1 n=1 Tax=Hyphodiscus hymeniophilus TaxID=353542 RepID=A0A9P6VDS2_9HELO|nr:DNA excision repair ckn1 [Hyphodiscus hymeniophilus]
MNQLLYDRSAGSLSPQAFALVQTAQRLHAVQPSPRLLFDGGEKEEAPVNSDGTGKLRETADLAEKIWAHQAGVNSLSLDIENRLLISGGADTSIKIWDLGECPNGAVHTFKPTATVPKKSSHKFGITQLNFYPFDSAAFLSSSYDHHLKLYATETLSLSADFDLNSIIYTHALSPIASHLLVACATQHPAVRLVDLRSGSNTHSLAGHHGALLSLAWSPMVEYILASGGIDGTVRLWDIRKSSSSLGVLDVEDSIGIRSTDEIRAGGWGRQSAKAHHGAVNGITWTDDGAYIISAGHDERMRVWDAATGANTLASFGPTLKNSHLSNLPLVTCPTSSTPPGKAVLFYPNEKELLMFELHEGRILKRLKVPGPIMAAVRSRTGERNVKSRITALVWRGQCDGVYSAHTDGQIRAWLPRTVEDDILDEEEEQSSKMQVDDETAGGKRKRQVLDDVFKDLTKQKISFG